MTKGITLSEKHGVNPTLPVCFWCGEENGTVALLGRLPGDIEAPRHPVLDYDPCDECRENFALGIALIECTEYNSNNLPPIQETPQLFPTGRLLVIKPEAVSRIFDEDTTKQLLSVGRGYIDTEAFDMFSIQ